MPRVNRLLGPEERLLYQAKQHWTAILGRVVLAALTSLLIGGVAIGLSKLESPLPLPPAWVLILLFFPFIQGGLDLLRWRRTAYLVTDQRLIQMEGLWRRQIQDCPLQEVGDIVLRQGLLGKLLSYGDLVIMTAGKPGYHFERVSAPATFKKALLEQQSLREEQALREQARLDIPSQIAGLAALREKGIISDSEFQAKKAELLSRM
jgi:uncharacterized membrane protein YdbT with pleckstrin-like domain